jgi:hypothetical protein
VGLRGGEEGNICLCREFKSHLKFEILTAMIPKSTVFRDVTPSSLVEGLPTFRMNIMRDE